jgi:hypothetical protein
MRKIGAASPIPHSTIAIGIHAIGLIGRKIWTSGFAAANTVADSPIHNPSGMPIATAIV